MANQPKTGDSATQASVIPFRFVESELQFCLITTRRSNRWGFPKGRIGKQESVVEAALQEALEEAGVRGEIVGDPIGAYRYQKQNEKHSVIVMLMHVDHCEADWKESGERQRAWVSRNEATDLLDRTNLIGLLQAAVRRLEVAPLETRHGKALRA